MTLSSGFSNPGQAEAAFYHAFLKLDAVLMERVWSDGPETVCVHPGGDLLWGKAAVLQSWAEIFASAQRPSLRYQALQTTSAGDIVIHLVEETIRPGTSPDTAASRVLATNIYRRGTDGWRMTTHHASLPVMGSSRNGRPGQLH